MQKLRKNSIACSLLTAAAVALTIGGGIAHAAEVDGPPVHWKFSMWGKPRAVTAGLEFLSEQLEEKTGGNFKFQIFYGEQLSKAKENLDGLKSNSFEAALICNFYHPGKTPALMVLTLPFLPMTDFDRAAAIRHGIYQHPILGQEINKWNAIYYSSTHVPQYEFLGRGTPPTSLDGWKGLRVRAGGGIGEAMEKLGAVRQSMPATEVYTAIQRGTADAVSFPYTYAHAAYSIDEVADWYTTNLAPGTSDCPILFNKTAYEALPPQYQELLMSLREGVTSVYKNAYAEADKKFLPRFAENMDGIVYDNATRAEFQKIAGQPVWDEWVAKNQDKFDAQAVLDRVLELGGDEH